MKPTELRDLSDAELREKLRDLRAERFQVGYAFSMGVPPEAGRGRPNNALMRDIRRDIARILAILHERELWKQQQGGTD